MYSNHSEKLILPTKEMFMSLGRGTVYEETMHYEGDIKNSHFMYNTDVYYFVYNMANYYHFIYDTLPYLYSYFYEKEYLVPQKHDYEVEKKQCQSIKDDYSRLFKFYNKVEFSIYTLSSYNPDIENVAIF